LTTTFGASGEVERAAGLGLIDAETDEARLSRREKQCLQLLAVGCGNSEIANELAITLPTVAMHIANAKRRLKARTREHAIAIALATGAIEYPAGHRT